MPWLSVAEFRTGVRLGVDWGKARVGVSACDPNGTLAYPVETLPAASAVPDLVALVAEYEPIEVVVGLPIDLRGERGPAADYVLSQAHALAAKVAVPVLLSDERLSTVSASRRLSQSGKNSKAQRRIIDQAAAVEILQAALEAQRRGRTLEVVIAEVNEAREKLG